MEHNKEAILNNLLHRGRGFRSATPEAQRAFAHASWLFGQWLAQEAGTHQIPILLSQPQESVLERLLTII